MCPGMCVSYKLLYRDGKFPAHCGMAGGKGKAVKACILFRRTETIPTL